LERPSWSFRPFKQAIILNDLYVPAIHLDRADSLYRFQGARHPLTYCPQVDHIQSSAFIPFPEDGFSVFKPVQAHPADYNHENSIIQLFKVGIALHNSFQNPNCTEVSIKPFPPRKSVKL
jgi:hypothetical protein